MERRRKILVKVSLLLINIHFFISCEIFTAQNEMDRIAIQTCEIFSHFDYYIIPVNLYHFKVIELVKRWNKNMT